jgi:Coenzyme PQQ synthesis protein D (PqqD)
MNTRSGPSLERTLNATLRIPSHVAVRGFDEETVVLNLDTGRYYSLNPSGGRFLEILGVRGSFREALGALKAELAHVDADVLRSDLHAFSVALASQGLLEIVVDESGDDPP